MKNILFTSLTFCLYMSNLIEAKAHIGSWDGSQQRDFVNRVNQVIDNRLGINCMRSLATFSQEDFQDVAARRQLHNPYIDLFTWDEFQTKRFAEMVNAVVDCRLQVRCKEDIPNYFYWSSRTYMDRFVDYVNAVIDVRISHGLNLEEFH